MENLTLDHLDTAAIAKVMDALHELEKGNVQIHTITFSVYQGQHRVRASRRGRWASLKIAKIVSKW